MAKETINPKVTEMNKYQYGGLAARLAKDNPELIGASLEMLADELDAFSVDKGRRKLFQSCDSDPRLMKGIIESYAGTYAEALSELTFGELFNYYKTDVIEEYIEPALMDKYETKFKEYENDKVSDIMQKVATAKYTLDGEKHGVILSDEDKENAEETLKKYEVILNMFHLIEDIKFNDKLRPNVHKKALEILAERL